MMRRLFSSQLRVNMASGVVTSILNIAVLGVAYPVYLSFLDYELYGIWLVLAVVLNLAQLGDLGISQAVTKLVAEEYGQNNIRNIESYVFTALAVLCVSGSVILLIVLRFDRQIIGLFKLSVANEAIALKLLPYVGILSVYVLMVQLFGATLSGLGRMDITNYCRTLNKVITVGIATILLWKGYGIESLLLGNVFAFITMNAVCLIFIRRTAKIRFLKTARLDTQRLKKLLNFGGTVFGSSIMAMLLGPFNKMMLSRYAGVELVPIYEIAYNSAVRIRALVESALRPIMPEISILSQRTAGTTIKRIRAINRKSMALIIFGGLPLFAILLLVARPLLQLWLQEKYNEAIPMAFRLMLVCTFVSLVGVPAFHTLLGLGKAKCYLVSSMIVAGGNFVLVGATALLVKRVWLNGILEGLFFLSALSAAYLIIEASREIGRNQSECHK